MAYFTKNPGTSLYLSRKGIIQPSMWMAWTFLPLIQKSALQELNKTEKYIRTLFTFILLYWLCLFSYLNWQNGTWILREICRFWVQNAILTGLKKPIWSQNFIYLTWKTKIWPQNQVSRRFGRYSFQYLPPILSISPSKTFLQ